MIRAHHVRLRTTDYWPAVGTDATGAPLAGYASTEKKRIAVTVKRRPVGWLLSDQWRHWKAELLDGTSITGDFGYDGWRRALGALLSAVSARGEAPTGSDARPSTAAEHLRSLAARGQHGAPTTPATYYLNLWCGSDASRDLGYELSDARRERGEPLDPEGWRTTAAVLIDVEAVWKRLRRFAEHRESATRWVKVREVAYADNSDEVEEVCEELRSFRRRLTRAPSGDACF